MKTQRTGYALVVSLLLGLMLGCDGNAVATYPVSGRVVFSDGTPVTFGSVEFHHAEHDLTSSGSIEKDGTFRLGTFEDGDGAPAGSHEAVVIQLIMNGQAGVTPHEHGRHIDGRYADYGAADLTFEVSADGENEFEIVVEPQSKR